MSSSTRPATVSGRPTRRAIPPIVLVFGAILSVQIGSTVAKGLFASLGPGGATFLRVAFAAVLLLFVVRPDIRGRGWSDLALAAGFGLDVAVMNLSFYTAIDRIPLGVAVTLEFVGPLGVAVVQSRRSIDFLWVTLAAAGIALLAPWGGLHMSGTGMAFGLLAGLFWAGYILFSARVGRAFPGGSGLAIAMVVGGLALAPVGVASAGRHLLRPGLLLAGFIVALLSAVIPYSLELEALRSVPTRVFGVLMSLEPAVGAIVGFLVLRQVLDLRAVLAIVCVTIASLGATRGAPAPITD